MSGQWTASSPILEEELQNIWWKSLIHKHQKAEQRPHKLFSVSYWPIHDSMVTTARLCQSLLTCLRMCQSSEGCALEHFQVQSKRHDSVSGTRLLKSEQRIPLQGIFPRDTATLPHHPPTSTLTLVQWQKRQRLIHAIDYKNLGFKKIPFRCVLVISEELHGRQLASTPIETCRIIANYKIRRVYKITSQVSTFKEGMGQRITNRGGMTESAHRSHTRVPQFLQQSDSKCPTIPFKSVFTNQGISMSLQKRAHRASSPLKEDSAKP